jgi:hypothetical protein
MNGLPLIFTVVGIIMMIAAFVGLWFDSRSRVKRDG